MPDSSPNESAVSIDVVVPCYQYGRFLRQCVTSVLTQGYRDVRVLIVDNASTDNSVEVAKQLAEEDTRVELVARRNNLGLHASWNEGVEWARSKYFMVLCADDFLVPDCFATTISVMEHQPKVGFAFGRPAYLRPKDTRPLLDSDAKKATWRIVPGRDLLEQFCREGVNHVPGSGVLVRTVAQKLAGYYRRELPYTTDFEMWMRLARLGPAARTDAQLAVYRLHSSALKARACRDYACERPPALPWEDEAAFKSFFTHEGASLPEAPRLRRLAKRGLAERAYWAALAHLCRGQPGVARDLFKFAFQRRPITAVLPPVSYLSQRDNAMDRMIDVASELIKRSIRVRWHSPSG